MVASSRKPFKFHARYCLGHKDEDTGYWVSTGCSPLAKTELKERLSAVMIQRKRTEIWKDTPPKQYQLVRVEPKTEKNHKALDKLTKQPALQDTHIQALLDAALKEKLDAIIENVLQDLTQGGKTIVWCSTRNGVEVMIEALEKACNNKKNSAALNQHDLLLLATHGEASIPQRNRDARQFRTHEGSACIVVTYDSMPEAISLYSEVPDYPTATQHMAQLHFVIGTIGQATNRAYNKMTKGLMTLIYVLKGSADERVEAGDEKKFADAAAVTNDSDMEGLQTALSKRKPETVEEWKTRFLDSQNLECELEDMYSGDSSDE